jgi:hypothetical protein
MTAKASFHIIGYLFGLAAFASIYIAIRPSLVARGREAHLKALIPVHFFRYFGLTALLPGVFDLGPAGFSEGYLTQIIAGDVLAAIQALVSFFLLQTRASLAIPAVWIFNVVATLDYLNAGARVTPSIHDANILGPFGWIVMTVCLPAWLVSHIAIFFALRQSKNLS